MQATLGLVICSKMAIAFFVVFFLFFRVLKMNYVLVLQALLISAPFLLDTELFILLGHCTNSLSS